MYKRDLITAEIEKIAQVLAKIVGLKKELKLAGAEALFEETLLTGFGLEKNIWATPDDEIFLTWLKAAGHQPEKLNLLSDFLFGELDFENKLAESQLLARKLNMIYLELIEQHQIVHLINLGRQKYILQYV